MRTRRLQPLVRILAPLLIAAAGVSTGAAQQVDSLRQQYRLPALPLFGVPNPSLEIAPGLTIGTPSALGADFGVGFVGVGYQHTTRWGNDSDPDGAVVVGFGVGDADEIVGVEVALTSLGTFRSFGRGGASVKVHRRLARKTAVAVGWENMATWEGWSDNEEGATDAGSSLYAVGTRSFVLRPGYNFSVLTLSVGVGNGRFRAEDDIIDDRETVNPFGSVSLRLARPVAGIVDWTGQDLIAGLSILPVARWPLFVTPAVADLTNDPRFILGVGFGFDYRPLF